MNQTEACKICHEKKVNNRTGICSECRKNKCFSCGKHFKFNVEHRNFCGRCKELFKADKRKYQHIGMIV